MATKTKAKSRIGIIKEPVNLELVSTFNDAIGRARVSGDAFLNWTQSVINLFYQSEEFYKRTLSGMLEHYLGRGTKVDKNSIVITPTIEYKMYSQDESEDVCSIEDLAKLDRDHHYFIKIRVKAKVSHPDYQDRQIEAVIGSLEVRRMINCCGAAVFTNISYSYESQKNKGGIGSLLLSIGEALAYVTGYRLGMITTYNKPASTNVLTSRLDWKIVSEWTNTRTSANLAVLTKDLALSKTLKNLESLFNYACNPRDTK